MCGIVGMVDHGRGVARAGLRAPMDSALARLAPRGPDGDGTWFDRRCALGHRRLAVVDTSAAGAQPMQRDGLVITYNGMIYNFRELRRALERRGRMFETRSDTEVLLAGWREWGAELLPRLDGMFAFALWDAKRGELVLARDRFGKKPILYRHHGARLVFASDLVALQRLDASPGRVDPASLRLYFALRYLPEPYSILEGVRKLPPGHLARFSASGLEIGRWYDLPASRPPRYRDEEDAAADLADRFESAIRQRMFADVPVGAFLSGGIDSAIVVSSMAANSAKVRTFTVGFEGAPDYYEERPAARAVAEHCGAEHTEITVSAADMRGALDAVFDGLDEPFADSSAVPTYLMARETRRHVTVALSGDGADEVFGGYRKYQGELLAETYRRLPALLRRAVIEPAIRALPEGKGHPVLERARRLRRFAAHAGKDAAGRQAGWARLLVETELDQLFAAPAEAAARAPSIEQLVAGLRAAANDSDPINAMLIADLGLVLPGDMLVKADRMSMANGLELRSPFLDHRVVECAAAMPGAFKLARGAGKRILRKAFAARLPEEVFARPKKGFEVPLAEWLRGDLNDLARRAVEPKMLLRQGLFRPEIPGRWLTDLESGRRDKSWELWTLISFQAWAERNFSDVASLQ